MSSTSFGKWLLLLTVAFCLGCFAAAESMAQEQEESASQQFQELTDTYFEMIEHPDITNRERRKLRSETTKMVFELLELVEDSELSVQMLNWVIEVNGKNRKARKAAKMIAEKYFDQPGIGDALDLGTNTDVLLRIIQKNSDTDVQVIAKFLMAMQDKDEATRETVLLTLLDNHPEVVYRGKKLEEHIRQPLIESRLRVGKIAPDIEGPDIDDVEFKLSDYRGKVVVLDFWGDW